MDNGFAGWVRFEWECVGMWIRLSKPTSPFVSTVSLMVMIVGAIGWGWARLTNVTGTSEMVSTVSAVAFYAGASVWLGMLVFWAPYKKWYADVKRLNSRIAELTPLQDYMISQKGNEGAWLRLVAEIIDLGRHGNHPEKEVHVRFQIDSGLTFDLQPNRMWVSLVLGGVEPSEPEYEVRQPPNLLKGSVSQLASMPIPINNEKVWEAVKEIRQGRDITKALKVELQLETGKPSIFLRSPDVYPDRVNDMRQ